MSYSCPFDNAKLAHYTKTDLTKKGGFIPFLLILTDQYSSILLKINSSYDIIKVNSTH